jgi:predicted O-linked N-acetylglucosamine transferase (SPINDLY family)
MEIEDCVAADFDDYVNLAVLLANDNAWSEKIRHELEAKSSILVGDRKSAWELETIFERLVNQSHYTKKRLINIV